MNVMNTNFDTIGPYAIHTEHVDIQWVTSR